MSLVPLWHAHLPMENFQFLLSKVPADLLHLRLFFYRIILTDDGTWGADIFNGHAIGCNAVSWAPATLPGSLITPQQHQPTAPGGNPDQPAHATVKRFASAGCDNLVKIWGFR